MSRRFFFPEGLVEKHHPGMEGTLVRSIGIDDFLRLAQPSPNLMGDTSDLFEKDMIDAWEDLPMLQVDPETRFVFGHEGRHRAVALRNSGYDEMEIIVIVGPDPLRFGGNVDAMLAWRWDCVNGDLPGWHQFATEAEFLGL